MDRNTFHKLVDISKQGLFRYTMLSCFDYRKPLLSILLVKYLSLRYAIMTPLDAVGEGIAYAYRHRHLRLKAIYNYIHGLFYLNQSRRLKTSQKETHSMGKSKSILTMQKSIKHIQLSYSYKNYKAVCRASI